MITRLDFVAIPSTDAERTRSFYVDTLGLRADDAAHFEFWVGETCCGIWEPAQHGRRRSRRRRTATSRCTSTTSPPRARELEAKGVEFVGETFDTGVCHMAFFTDPDGNDLMLHNRYKPRE